MKTQTTVRIDKTSYNKAKEILKILGLNYSQAISLFNNMVILNNGLPFDARIPNAKSKNALNEFENKNGETFNNIDDLFQHLDK